MKRRFDELMETRRWVYWLDQSCPEERGSKRFRVSIVFENEPGHYPMGGGDILPWFWDKETCKARNEKLGHNEETVMKIVMSSMFPGPNASE